MMKEIAKFVVGSCAFFGSIDGFTPHDTDVLYLMDGWELGCDNARIKIDGKDCFLYPDKGLALVDDCLVHGDPLTAGKFLVRGFCDHIGATIEDVKRLETLFFALDEKHRYETHIYECYMKNGGFWLEKKQLFESYDIYKKVRLM